jgi:hypothetical protein
VAERLCGHWRGGVWRHSRTAIVFVILFRRFCRVALNHFFHGLSHVLVAPETSLISFFLIFATVVSSFCVSGHIFFPF